MRFYMARLTILAIAREAVARNVRELQRSKLESPNDPLFLSSFSLSLSITLFSYLAGEAIKKK